MKEPQTLALAAFVTWPRHVKAAAVLSSSSLPYDTAMSSGSEIKFTTRKQHSYTNQDDLPTVHIPTHMPSRSQQQQQHAMDLSPLCAKQYSAATTGAHRKIKGFSQDEQS